MCRRLLAPRPTQARRPSGRGLQERRSLREAPHLPRPAALAVRAALPLHWTLLATMVPRAQATALFQGKPRPSAQAWRQKRALPVRRPLSTLQLAPLAAPHNPAAGTPAPPAALPRRPGRTKADANPPYPSESPAPPTPAKRARKKRSPPLPRREAALPCPLYLPEHHQEQRPTRQRRRAAPRLPAPPRRTATPCRPACKCCG